MSIPPESIQVGRCYLTADGTIRRVISTDSNGRVRYAERAGAGPWRPGRLRSLKRQDFAAAVVREVPCAGEPEENGAE